MALEEDLRLAEQIPGQVSPEEGARLYELGQRSPGSVVEIGSFKGRSTAFLALGSRAGNGHPVFAVDHFEGSPEHQRRHGGTLDTFPDFQRNMARVGTEWVTAVRASSSAAIHHPEIPREIGLLFIDGAHDRESVEKDLACWVPRLMPGGILALHDVCRGWASGPRKAVVETLLPWGEFRKPHRTSSLLDLERRDPESLKDEFELLMLRFRLRVLGPVYNVKDRTKDALRDFLRPCSS